MPIQFPSEGREGRTEEFYLQTARGHVKGHSVVHVVGRVPDMSNNGSGTVWDLNDTNYPWNVFSSAGTLNVTRNASESNTTIITIQGLDENYNPLTENVLLLASTNNFTTNSFIRVNKVFISSDSGTNQYTINVKRETQIVAQINANVGETLMGVYTVPAGYTGFILQGDASIKAGADSTVSFYGKVNGTGVFRLAHTLEISGDGGQYRYPFKVPRAFPERSDLDVRASVRTNKARVTASFDILLVKNEAT